MLLSRSNIFVVLLKKAHSPCPFQCASFHVLSPPFILPWPSFHRFNFTSGRPYPLTTVSGLFLKRLFLLSPGVCPVLCSNHGQYGGGLCHCEEGWKGAECDVPERDCEVPDCSGRGRCINGKCRCAAGWKGNACELGEFFIQSVFFKGEMGFRYRDPSQMALGGITRQICNASEVHLRSGIHHLRITIIHKNLRHELLPQWPFCI
ncbi:hypothetical protein J437_LFUL015144 [Ladona fulva]|uniref:EGF-like domain-containing protein n=1 Tax=Ladona fulva TaxID=123851 RepID=A0A8K0P3D3_LADFU|nr:hypothetical protein J437_LFUL015144 [Ladona fulva]